MLSVITPTRDRPGAFALCRHWMERSTIRPQWIVVDDGDVAIEAPEWAEYVRRPPSKESGTNGRNVMAGLELVRGDAVVMIEDDDWFPATHLEGMYGACRANGGAKGVICSGIRMYHVGYRHCLEKGRNPDPPLHGMQSMSSFAVTSAGLGAFWEAVAHCVKTGGTGIDQAFYDRAVPDLVSVYFTPPVFLKGFAGRWACTTKHQKHHWPGGQDDKSGDLLRKWVGPEDAAKIVEMYDGVR